MAGGKIRREWHLCNYASDSFPGTLPKPSIWADPGLMATKGSPVTLWCQTSLQADAYYLYKERVSGYLPMEISQDSKTKASYSIELMSTHEAGRYQCAYQSRKSWSQRSDFLTLVVTGKGRC